MQRRLLTARFLFQCPHTGIMMNTNQDLPSNPRKPNPFIWVTWLSRLMAGERHCQWASWFRCHYEWKKVPSGCDLARWTADHAELLRSRRAALEAQGFTVYTEAQNSFTLTGAMGIEVSGKPDIVAIKDADKLPSYVQQQLEQLRVRLP